MIPNREVCKQALGAILNLAVNAKVRARIGFLGGIQALLGKYFKARQKIREHDFLSEDEKVKLVGCGVE